MINAVFFRNKNKNVCGFKITNHGKEIVCAAVSALTINTVNSIERLASGNIEYRFDEHGGYIEATVPKLAEDGEDIKTQLLLDSLELGLLEIVKEYPKEIKISYTNK